MTTRVYARGAGTAAGVGTDALLVAVTEPTKGSVKTVTLDVSAVASNEGGDWLGRAHVVQLIGCTVTASAVKGCTGQKNLPTRTDPHGHLSVAWPGTTGTATVTPAASAATTLVLAAAAAPAGSTGSYAATSLSPSSTWAAGSGAGDFTWSDPLAVPPAPGDLTPDLAVTYDSGIVDGRVSAANNQPSWLGDGFDLAPGGYIERRYIACSDDMTGSNTTTKTGDLCWKSDNATIDLDGTSGPLVKDSSSGTWRMYDDDGSKITHYGTLGAAGEYWTLTTIDGTTYTFGKGTPVVGSGSTNSAWSVPVFGNQSGEPCYKSGNFAGSVCSSAVWRWNLDSVVDAHGNAEVFRYTAETNHYGENNNHTVVSYTRGGYLSEIDYGLRTDATSTPASGKVVFTTAERCIPTSSFTNCAASNLTSANQAHWPDVPFSQICTAATGSVSKPATGGCSPAAQQVPTFFSRIRLTAVATQVLTGASSYSTVDTWTFGQKFLDPGDTTSQLLWTSTIAHTGNGGTALDAPITTLVPMSQPTPNRVDAVGDGAPAINRFRLSWIDNGTGGTTSVGYTPIDCTPSNHPSDPASNTRRCFPAQYLAPGATSPTLNWFNKYLVSRVVQTDNVDFQPSVTTSYQYLGGAAWHFDRDDVVPAKQRTWGQWRGYQTVRTFTGGSSGPWTTSESLYLRGMDGDCANASCSTTKSVSVTDSRGGSITDADLDDGFTRESRTFASGTPTFDSGGNVTASSVGAVLTDTLDTPTLGAGTASDGTRTARIRSLKEADARTYRSDGGFEDVDATTSYDAYGQPLTQELATNDAGTTCTTTTYANDTTGWIHDAVTSTRTVADACSATPTLPDDLLSGSRTLYDGATTWSATPPLTHADPTTSQALVGWDSGAGTYLTTATTSYDAVGRPVSVTDAEGHATTTAYTPALAGPTTAEATTNALGQTSSITLSPGRGQTLTSTDANNNVTTEAYDALGELTGVWLPGRATTATASRTYGYTFGTSSTPSKVTSGTLRNSGNYTYTATYYDGLLRPVETQTPATGNTTARLVTQTTYDERGQDSVVYGPVLDTTGTPGDGLVAVDDGSVPNKVTTSYDGAGRPTRVDTRSGAGSAAWHTVTTTTGYDGNITTTVPPDGATPQTVISDALGHTTTLRQYTTTAGTSGASQDTTYTYRADGLLASMTDPAGDTWTRSYDLQGQLVRSVDPDTGTTTTSYDDDGNIATTTDAKHQTLAYGYDALDRKTAEHADSATGALLASWAYDTATGGKGLPASSTRYVDGDAYTRTVTGYDNQGRVTGTKLTIPASQSGLAGTYTTATTYNLDGQVKTYLMPTAAGIAAAGVTPAYTSQGVPYQLSIGGAPGGGGITGTTYSAYGEPSMVQAGVANATVYSTYAYADGTRRLVEAAVSRSSGSGDLADTRYVWDDAGNLTKAADTTTDTGVGPADTDTQCYSYDPLGHLTGAWTPASGDCATAPTAAGLGGPAPYWDQWTYDNATGARKTQTVTAADGTAATTSYAAVAHGGDQPHTLTSVTTGGATTGYAYDADGNTTTVTPAAGGATGYTWDAEGHLAATSGPAGDTRNIYDADGALLIAADPAGSTLYADATTEIRHDTGTGAVSVTHTYTWLGKTVAEMTSTTTGNTLTYLATDPENTGQIAIAAAQAAVTAVRRDDPFGNPRGTSTGTWPTTHTFLDHPDNTTTGLVHLGARDYDPALGRFISPDPLLDLADPTQWNPYQYADANPTSLTDPDGTRPACLDQGSCTALSNHHGGIRTSTSPHDGYVRYHPNPHGPWAGNPYGGTYTQPGDGPHGRPAAAPRQSVSPAAMAAEAVAAQRAHDRAANAANANASGRSIAQWAGAIGLGLGVAALTVADIAQLGLDPLTDAATAGLAGAESDLVAEMAAESGEEAAGAAERTAAKGAASAGDHIVLGLKAQGLEATAAKAGGRTLLKDPEWMSTLQKGIGDPSTKFTVSLDGMSGSSTYSQVMQAAQRGASGAGGYTDWEMAQLFQGGRLADTTFLRGGSAVSNPFAP